MGISELIRRRSEGCWEAITSISVTYHLERFSFEFKYLTAWLCQDTAEAPLWEPWEGEEDIPDKEVRFVKIIRDSHNWTLM